MFVYDFACVLAASVGVTIVTALGLGRASGDGGCVCVGVVLCFVFPGVVQNGFFRVVVVT